MSDTLDATSELCFCLQCCDSTDGGGGCAERMAWHAIEAHRLLCVARRSAHEVELGWCESTLRPGDGAEALETAVGSDGQQAFHRTLHRTFRSNVPSNVPAGGGRAEGGGQYKPEETQEGG